MISTIRLRVFQVTAREGSVSGAALVLGCSQPTVSHHLSALEKELGAVLLSRHNRGIELTDLGRVLLEHADHILGELMRAEQSVRAHAQLEAGLLRIGTFPTAVSTFIPLVLRQFRRHYPAVQLALVEHTLPDEVMLEIRTRRVDLGLLFYVPDRPPDLPDVTLTWLFDDPLLAALPNDHPHAADLEVHMYDLADEPWVTQRSDQDPCHALLVRAAHAAGFTPNVSIHSDDYTTITQLVADGFGVALVPRLAEHHVADGARLLPLAHPPVRRRVAVATLSGGTSVAARAFVGLLRAAVANRQTP